MKLKEILYEKFTNTTFENAMTKMKKGYSQGLTTEENTCYAYVGNWLKNNPQLAKHATIRLWGLIRKDGSELIVHGDAILPNNKIISNMDPNQYTKGQTQKVRELSFDDFQSKYLN
jgi:hypothetical protein